MIISKIRLHMEKRRRRKIIFPAPFFPKIFMVIMTNKQDLFHNIFKYFYNFVREIFIIILLSNSIFFLKLYFFLETKILRYVSGFPRRFIRLKLNSLYRE